MVLSLMRLSGIAVLCCPHWTGIGVVKTLLYGCWLGQIEPFTRFYVIYVPGSPVGPFHAFLPVPLNVVHVFLYRASQQLCDLGAAMARTFDAATQNIVDTVTETGGYVFVTMLSTILFTARLAFTAQITLSFYRKSAPAP
jgi:hypothetical protein